MEPIAPFLDDDGAIDFLTDHVADEVQALVEGIGRI